MPRRDIREYIRSRWDARFLVNNIMGLLSKQQDPSGDVVLAIITASIRSYSKAYSGRMDRTQEEGTYEALKDYVSRAERNCTGRAEQNYTTERRGVSIEVSWYLRT